MSDICLLLQGRSAGLQVCIFIWEGGWPPRIRCIQGSEVGGEQPGRGKDATMVATLTSDAQVQVGNKKVQYRTTAPWSIPVLPSYSVDRVWVLTGCDLQGSLSS